jgi:hypothetical protein
MSWFNAKRNSLAGHDRASVSEVVACFRDEKDLLFRLAWLIAGDKATAEQSVVNACDMTIQDHSPFRDWLRHFSSKFSGGQALSLSLRITPA